MLPGMDRAAAQAREAIRDLVARYNNYGDAGRFDDLLDLFVDDAWLEIPGPKRFEGREELRGLFVGAASTPNSSARPERIAHHVATLVIDLAEDDLSAATGTCYYAVLGQNGLDHWGSYRDTYRCDAGTWRFTSRCVRVAGRIPGGWADRNLANL